jgi:hypothetical protein
VRLPRLTGPRVALVPVPGPVARAVLGDSLTNGLDAELAALGLRAGPGYPHRDSPDALRPLAEHGGDGAEDSTWLVVVGGEVVGECGGWPARTRTARCGSATAWRCPREGRASGTELVGVLCAWTDASRGPPVAADVRIGNEASRRLLRGWASPSRRPSRAGCAAYEVTGSRRSPVGTSADATVRVEQPLARYMGDRAHSPVPEDRMATIVSTPLPTRPRRPKVDRGPSPRAAARALRRSTRPTTRRAWLRRSCRRWPPAPAHRPARR